jgi:hypothetical protein
VTIGSDPAVFMNDFIDTAGWNTNINSQAILADAHWLKELLKKDLAKVHQPDSPFTHFLTS